MFGSILGSSYTLFMVSYGLESLSMSVFTWFTTVELFGTKNMEFLDCCTYGLFNIRVSVLRLLMFLFNGVHHNISTCYHKKFYTPASDVFILAVYPSYMFILCPS